VVNLDVDCTPFNARLTELGCADNQRRAKRAARLLAGGLPLGLIDHADMDRLLVCGRCERSTVRINEKVLLTAVRADLQSIMDRVEGMDWWRGEPEIAEVRRKARKVRYRKAAKEWEEQWYAKQERMDKVVAQATLAELTTDEGAMVH